MKKILTLLMGMSLTTTVINTAISCKANSTPEKDNGDFDYEGDLKILNTIEKQIADVFQQYEVENTLIDIKDYSIPEFENLFTIVSDGKPLQELEIKDSKLAPALLALKNNFMTVFDNINRKVANEYSNYYHDSFSMTTDQNAMKFNLNYIDINKLGKIANIDTNGLKGVCLDFKLEVKIKLKHYKFHVYLSQLNILLLMMLVRMQKILTAVTGTVSKAIVKFFNVSGGGGGDIIVDENPAYKKIYDNFDLNYASDHSMVDTIVQRELDTALQND